MPKSSFESISSYLLKWALVQSRRAVFLGGAALALGGCAAEPGEYLDTDEFPTTEATQALELGGNFLVNQLSGRCIDVQGAPATGNGALLQLWDCEYNGLGPNFTATDQKWNWR